MVAGGFKNDLNALDDKTPHDKRYARLKEYTTVIRELLASPKPVTYEGEFYHVNQLKIIPPLAPELFPGIFVSGSSEAGLATARETGATAIEYPKPSTQYSSDSVKREIPSGIRVGIIARQDEHEAWQVAYERFPEDRKGSLTHQFAMKVSDSVWHQVLSNVGTETPRSGTYWLRPFDTYKSFCPYLVGSHESVAEELARYIELGYHTFVLDVPASEEELLHMNAAFNRAYHKATPSVASALA